MVEMASNVSTLGNDDKIIKFTDETDLLKKTI